MISLRRCCAAMCALGLGAAVASSPALADDIELGSEASNAFTGVAWDDAQEEVLLTDESGTITALDTDSGDGREVTFTGEPESVQALGLFNSMLYIGDLGDEGANRDFVTVFRVDPKPGSSNYRAWDFSYPDGERDAKAMAVSGKGRIYIITGGEDPGVYRAALDPSPDNVNELVRAADAPEGVTDAVFLDDGATLLMRTQEGVDVIDAYTWDAQASTVYVDAPEGESVTSYGEERMLVGSGALLRDEPLPAGLTTATPVPSAEPTVTAPPPVDASPEPTARPTVAVEDSQTSEVSRSGTLFALVAAAAVAFLAGAVVFVARD